MRVITPSSIPSLDMPLNSNKTWPPLTGAQSTGTFCCHCGAGGFVFTSGPGHLLLSKSISELGIHREAPDFHLSRWSEHLKCLTQEVQYPGFQRLPQPVHHNPSNFPTSPTPCSILKKTATRHAATMLQRGRIARILRRVFQRQQGLCGLQLPLPL